MSYSAGQTASRKRPGDDLQSGREAPAYRTDAAPPPSQQWSSNMPNVNGVRVPSEDGSAGQSDVPPAIPAPSAQPELLRTSQIPSGPTVGPYGSTLATYSNKAVLKLASDLNAMATSWNNEEWTCRRRLVQFWRNQEGNVITTTFQPITLAEFVPSSIVISCIFRDDWNECFVTSVDTIYLLEALVGVRFTVEEKNRIRRNLEGFKPMTVSKGKEESEPFFKLIMGFPNPKPRNIEKDVKVFPWKVLGNALKKIIGKYSATYSAPIEATYMPAQEHLPPPPDLHPIAPPPPPAITYNDGTSPHLSSPAGISSNVLPFPPRMAPSSPVPNNNRPLAAEYGTRSPVPSSTTIDSPNLTATQPYDHRPHPLLFMPPHARSSSYDFLLNESVPFTGQDWQPPYGQPTIRHNYAEHFPHNQMIFPTEDYRRGMPSLPPIVHARSYSEGIQRPYSETMPRPYNSQMYAPHPNEPIYGQQMNPQNPNFGPATEWLLPEVPVTRSPVKTLESEVSGEEKSESSLAKESIPVNLDDAPKKEDCKEESREDNEVF